MRNFCKMIIYLLATCKSRASDVSISEEGCRQDDKDVVTSKTTLPTQLKASPEKQESLPPIHVTAKPEKIDNRTSKKENFDMKKPLHVETHSTEIEKANKAENKTFPGTTTKIENQGAYMDKALEKQIEESDIVRNTEENKNEINESFKDEDILKTPRHGKARTVSKISTLSSKKDENDETNTFQDYQSNNNSWVETFDDNKELLKVNSKTEIKKINDKATYSPIPVTILAQYVANKDKSDYTKEFQELSKVSINESKAPTKGHINTLQSNIQTKESPVSLEGEESSNINAYFINAGTFALKAYISYIGYSQYEYIGNTGVIKPSCKGAFWKTVLQERCGTVVMLTTEQFLLPEDKCRCFKGLHCSERYDDITVLCENGERNFGNFTVRKFTVMTQKNEREVQRLHFTKWPSYGLPDDEHVSSFVDFLTYANKISDYLDGPTIVYCSSGKERTGVFIALDILTKQGNDTGSVDIFGCVRQLREQRVNMINDCAQYKFLYKALVIALSDTSNI